MARQGMCPTILNSIFVYIPYTYNEGCSTHVQDSFIAVSDETSFVTAAGRRMQEFLPVRLIDD